MHGDQLGVHCFVLIIVYESDKLIILCRMEGGHCCRSCEASSTI